MSSTAVVARVGLDDRGFQEGVSKIQRSLKLVQSEFAAAGSKLEDFGTSTEGLKLKADSLNKQLDIQKKKVEVLKKGYQESAATKGEDAKATENLKIKLNYATVEMNKMETELDKTTKMLEIQSNSFTQLGTKIDEIGSKFNRIGDGFSNIGDSLTKNVTAPIIAAGAGLFKLASDFDDASDSIRIGTGAVGEDLAALENDFKQVYQSVNTSIDESGKVISDLNTRTGLSGESLQELSVQMIKLSKITGEDINTLIPAATRMFGDAGLSADEFADALDYTFKVSQSTGIGLSELQELMTQFGGPLRQMGFDWQSAAAMLGKFEKEGVNTNLVVGSMRIALGKMAREGISEPNKALAEMIEKIKEAGTAGEANALALEMFGAKAGPDMAAAIREGRLNIDELIESLKSSPETIEKVYSDTADAAEQFVMLKNKMAVSLEPLATTLFEAVNNAMPAIEKLVFGITGIIDKFNSLSPAQQEMIFKMALLAASIGPLLSILGNFTASMGSVITAVGGLSMSLGAAGGSASVLGTVFTALTGPISIVIGVVAGLTAAFAVLYKNNEEFRAQINRVWNEISSVISDIIEVIKQLFSSFIETTTALWDKYGEDLMMVISSAFTVISEIFSTALNAIKHILSIVTGAIKGDWQSVWESIKSLTSTIITGIKNIISTIFETIVKLVRTKLNAVKTSVTAVWNDIKTTTSKVWDSIVTAIEKPIESAKNIVKDAVEAIKNFFTNLEIPEIKIPQIKLPHFKLTGSFSLDPPSVPSMSVNWYAKGGIFNAPSIIGVGESGREAVIPIDRLDNILASALKKLNLKSDTGVTLKIDNFYNNTDKDIETLAYELQFYLERIQHSKGGF